jgi:regulator of sirC expression with transglutaminase-like and TPR domain
MSAPTECRPEAFAFFAEQLPELETTNGLLRASVAIAMHGMPDVVPLEVERKVSRLTDRVRQRVTGNSRQAMLAHLHDELFEYREFRGNVNDYYNPRNSFVPAVLDSGLGIPISLSLIYKVVATRLGLRVEGVNAPGHFMVLVATTSRPMLIDPFFRGQMLSRDEAFARMDDAVGRRLPRSERNLRPATHKQWIGRMLQNLVGVYAAQGQPDEVAAMSELAQLLGMPIF